MNFKIKVNQIQLTATHPMVKKSCYFINGAIVPNPDEPLNDWKDSDIRIIVKMDEEQKKIYDEQTVKHFYLGAFSYRIEPETIHTEHARSENIAEAVTLTDQFKQWSIAVEKQDKITDEVITEIQDIELEYHKKAG